MNKSSQSPRATIESAGSILRATRTAKGIPVEQVAHDLRMRPQQVLDLEQDDHARLPHTSYVRLLILYYARYLDIAVAHIEPHLPERSNFRSGGYQTVCQQLPYHIGTRKTVEPQFSSLPAQVVPAISTCCIILIVIAVGAGVYFSYRHSREEQNRLKPPPPGAAIQTEAKIAKKPAATLETMRAFDSAVLEKVPQLTTVDPPPLKLTKRNNLETKAEFIRNASRMSFLPSALPQITPERVMKALRIDQNSSIQE